MSDINGFWSFLSTLVIAGAVIWIFLSVKPQIISLLTGRHLTIRLLGQEISFAKLTEDIGQSVADLQARVASMQVSSVVKGDGLSNSVEGKHKSRRRILWVDDFPSNNAFILKNLENRKFDVEISLGTNDALEKFVALDHNMIITDLGRMESGVNNKLAGLELVKRVRIMNVNVPVLVFAGHRGVEMKSELLEAGATAVTSSGIDVMKFINTYMN